MIELAIIATLPLLLAVEGELVVQRAGMINLGIEGMLLTAALTTVLFGFAENMSAGRGYIALSIVIFGRWKIKGVLLGSALFGAAAVLQYSLQASSSGVQFHLLLAVPYVVTLLILCGIAGRVRAPEALGK